MILVNQRRPDSHRAGDGAGEACWVGDYILNGVRGPLGSDFFEDGDDDGFGDACERLTWGELQFLEQVIGFNIGALFLTVTGAVRAS